MSEFKEVWYPASQSGKVSIYAVRGVIREGKGITIYTLGRKRRRCQSCHGAKFHSSFGFGCAPAFRVIEHKTPCLDCNGTGWEYKQGVE